MRHLVRAPGHDALEGAIMLAGYIDDLVALFDHQGRFVYASPSYVRVLGVNPERLIGAVALDHIHPADHETVVALWAAAAPQSATFRQRHGDGGWRWLAARATPLLWRGAPVCITVANDITSARQAEDERAQLLGREQAARVAAEMAAARTTRLQAATAALAEELKPERVAAVIVEQGISAIGAQAGSIVLLSEDRATLELVGAVGYSADLLERWRSFPLSTPAPLAEAVRTSRPILLESAPVRDASYPQLAEPHAPGSSQAWAALPLIVNGRAVGGMGFSFAEPRVFTADDHAFMQTLAQQCAQALERAQLYEAERRVRIEAEAAVRIRDQFLQVASHELKTPLTVLYGNAQLLARRALRDGNLSARDQHTIRVIVDQATRLNKLIDAMLDITRLQSGRLAVARERIDLSALVHQVVAEVLPALTQHSLECVTPAEALIADADPLLLEQVIQNLIQNAVKYSPAGGQIWVLMERHGARGCIQVRDQGLGIPASALPHLFQRFYRASNVESQQISGLGIGLYVAREIMAQHGGTIVVESAEGVGSSFTACLPLVKAVADAAEAPAQREVGGATPGSGASGDRPA